MSAEPGDRSAPTPPSEGGELFEVVRRRSTAGEFHALPIPEPARPEIWVLDVTRPALVLGSTQRLDVVDVDECERRGIEVVRRRSGGGAVVLVPGETVWVDVLLTADGPGWSPDIHRPMVWLGRHLEAAFRAVGVNDVRVHDGAMVDTDHSRLICFDGIGPGELVRSNGSKVVGISQRRTRSAARLQCCWYGAYEPALLPALLHGAPDSEQLRPVATIDADQARAIVAELAERLASTPSNTGS